MKAKINSKELIIDTALDLIIEKGYSAMTMRDIANRAGISLGLAYNYFENKNKILEEIIRIGIEDIRITFFRNNGESQNTIDEYFDRFYETAIKNKKLWNVIHQLRLNKEITNSISSKLESINKDIINNFNLMLSNSRINLNMIEVMCLFAQLDGLMAHYLIMENYPLQSTLENIKQNLKLKVNNG